MKNYVRAQVMVGLGLMTFLFNACETTEQKEERLAKNQCGSCHAFPEPSLLRKGTWEQGVLSQMRFRMGFEDLTVLADLSEGDMPIVLHSRPATPMISEADFEAIKNYYLRNAPDSLTIPAPDRVDTLRQFEAHAVRLPIANRGMVTMIRMDSSRNELFVGDRFSNLYQLDHNFTVQDSFKLASPPSHMIFRNGDDPLLSLMGIMNPNDQSKGQLVSLQKKSHHHSVLIDSLKRPVSAEYVDLDNDKIKDFVVCAFGNYTGALLAFKSRADGTHQMTVLSPTPGARNVIIRDVDKNGLPDVVALMSQGDERIVVFYNYGNFTFRQTTLLRFSPVYGSSYFEINDFNNDGHFDILYTNGDNADYSSIFKPYHGVRLFLNNGKNNFDESWFYPLHGASQVRSYDYDQDGDLDFGVISYFPDFEKQPERGFVYFENKDGKFIPSVTGLALEGHWITMEATDIDHDGDCDIILGALNLNFGGKIPGDILSRWQTHQTSLLYLENTLK